MSTGLPVSRLINVAVNLTPSGAAFANFNSLLVVGNTDVIDTDERLRSYASLDEVSDDFGNSAPEYLAAREYFSQKPRPTQLYIGRWAQGPTNGQNRGGALSAAQKALANFTAITAGSLKIAIDGASAVTITGLNFSAATNLNAVAAIIDTALTGANCIYDGARFIISSATTGATSSISFATAPASGTDIKTVCALTEALGARLVTGIAAESALEAVQVLDDLTTYWYGLMFASVDVDDDDHVAVAGYIQTTVHAYGLTTDDAAALDPVLDTDIGSVIKALGYDRTFGQYSSSNPYAVASLFGRILTTDFNANNSLITLMYKQEPGVVAEELTTTQANALDAKRYNYFVSYDNGTNIVMNGMMFGDAFVDEIYGTDWLANHIQTGVYNRLYTSLTKIPQTDSGNTQLANAIDASCALAVTNGLLAPGTWNSGGFGQLAEGDYLPKGYYIYTPPIALQPQADRAQRKSVTFQVAAKLAGAIHDVDVLVNVNR